MIFDKASFVLYRPRMLRSRKLFWSMALATGLLLILILTDTAPGLRGPVPDSDVWHWAYYLRPYSRWWAVLLPAGGIAIVISIWLWVQPRRWLARPMIFLLISLSFLLQLGIIYADRAEWWAELLDRTLAVQTNGYFWTAAQIPSGGMTSLLHEYPQAMATFESDHARTHPPGLVMVNWLTIQLMSEMPGLSESIARTVRPQRCTDLWLLNQPAGTIAALALWAILPLLVAATAVLPAYYLTLQLVTDKFEPAARLAGGFTAVLPALLMMTPLADQLYPALTLWLFASWYAGWQRQNRLLFFSSGCLLSLASFLSLGNAVLGVALLTWWGWNLWTTKQLPHPQRWISQLIAFGLGAITLWGLFWLIWQVPPWQIASAGLAEHYAATTSQRGFTRWLPYNLLDLFLFAGPLVLFGFASLITMRNKITDQPETESQPVFGLGLGTITMLLFLLFSGSTRGEVGRIWLFFMPLLAVIAAIFWQQHLHDKRFLTGLAWMHLIWAVGIALAWKPVGAVIVTAKQPPFPTPPANLIPRETQFGEQITLTGYDLVLSGPDLHLTVQWQAAGPTQRPFTVFNHLLDDNNQLVAQKDEWPVGGLWPPTCWRSGDIIPDQYTLTLPPELPAGTYRLFTGFYDAATLERLVTATGQDAFLLTELRLGNQ